MSCSTEQPDENSTVTAFTNNITTSSIHNDFSNTTATNSASININFPATANTKNILHLASTILIYASLAFISY